MKKILFGKVYYYNLITNCWYQLSSLQNALDENMWKFHSLKCLMDLP